MSASKNDKPKAEYHELTEEMEEDLKTLEPKLIRWSILLIIALIAVGILNGFIPNPIFKIDFGEHTPLIVFGILLLATNVLLNLIKFIMLKTLGHRVESEADIVALYNFISYMVWFVVIVGGIWVVLGGGGMVAGLGAGLMGAALIYVLQDPFLNIIAWIEIIVQKLFRLGDRIEINGVRGYVVDISIMNTTLREFENWMDSSSLTGRYVTIPNNALLTNFIFNYTRDTEFINNSVRVDFTYESDLKAAEAVLIQATQEVLGDLMQKNIQQIRDKYEFRDISDHTVEKIGIPIWRLADSSVNMQMRFFAPANRCSFYKTKIVKRVLEMVEENPRLSIAYPHMELVPYSDGPYPVVKADSQD